MTSRRLRVGWMSMLCLLAASAFAQSPSRIELGQRVDGTVMDEGGTFHAFAAAGGTRLQLVLTLGGALGAVTLYGADGGELARAEGEANVLLSHTLAQDGIYLVGVTSAAPGRGYTVALDGEEPGVDDGDELPLPATVAATASSAPSRPPPATASTPSSEAPAPFDADPAVWGVFAHLVGRRTIHAGRAYQLTWNWVRPGEELAEDWVDLRGRVAGRIVILPTGRPGELVMRAPTPGSKEWIGRVGEGGQVTFVGTGGRKQPFVIGIASGNQYQRRQAKVDATGAPIHIDPVDRRNLWVLAPAGE